MGKKNLIRINILNSLAVMLSCLMMLSNKECMAQQFNSDSWISKEHGTITLIPTYGQRNMMLMNTYSLFPKWEFTMAAYLYRNDDDPLTDDGHSMSFYAKYMFYENKTRTGGAAVKAGTGMFPGTLNEENRTNDAFQTFWMNFPCTIPLLNNKLQVDLMPGASFTSHSDSSKSSKGGFTYSTRAAWYPWNDKGSFVGEIFGSEGGIKSKPEYKIGYRWEPNQYSVFAFTYGQEFNGTNGAGFEIGVMLFTPPFACLGGCNKVKKSKKK